VRRRLYLRAYVYVLVWWIDDILNAGIEPVNRNRLSVLVVVIETMNPIIAGLQSLNLLRIVRFRQGPIDLLADSPVTKQLVTSAIDTTPRHGPRPNRPGALACVQHVTRIWRTVLALVSRANFVSMTSYDQTPRSLGFSTRRRISTRPPHRAVCKAP
jgi:hypothetical protein